MSSTDIAFIFPGQGSQQVGMLAEAGWSAIGAMAVTSVKENFFHMVQK